MNIIRTGLQYASDHRQWLASMAFSHAVGRFFSRREASTLADLSLHGRLTDVNFKSWLENFHDQESIKRAEENPQFYLFRTHLLSDFARKMVLPTFLVACSVLSIQNITLTEALKKLLSQSSKTSRVAIPALDLFAIACAPAAMKVVHMMFLYLNADKRHKYESIKHITGFLADKLETFSYLTFTLYSLGTSKTFYPTLIHTVYSLALEKLIPEKASLLSLVGPFITQSEYCKEPGTSWFHSIVHHIFYNDTCPTQDFGTGVNLFFTSLHSSSAPYDGEMLKGLYDKITKNGDVQKIQDLTQEVSDAFSTGKINREHAEALNKLIIQSIAEKFVKEGLAGMPEKFAALLKALNKQKELQALAKGVLIKYYDQLFKGFGEEAFRETGSFVHRKAFYEDQKRQIVELQSKVDTAHSDELKGRCQAYSRQLSPEVIALAQKEILNDKEIATLRTALKELYTTLIPLIDEEMKKEVVEMGCLDTEQKKVVYEKVAELFGVHLLTDEYEKHLTELFGMNGLFNQFHSNNRDDYYISIEFDYLLFNFNMKYYIDHRAEMGKKQELMLAVQARNACIDPKKVLLTPAFFKTLDEQSQMLLQRNPKAPVWVNIVNQTLPTMPEFEYRRLTALELPEDFSFVTKALEYWFQRLNSQTASPMKWDIEQIDAEMQLATPLSSSKEFRVV